MVGTIWSIPEPTTVTDGTLTPSGGNPSGKTYILSRAAGITVTMPAATGSGDIYRFYVKTTVTSNSYKIQAPDADTTFAGTLGVTTDAAGVVIPTAATTDTITMNGSTTGGVLGSYVEMQDIETDKWSVRGGLISTGTEATPFSAAVS